MITTSRSALAGAPAPARHPASKRPCALLAAVLSLLLLGVGIAATTHAVVHDDAAHECATCRLHATPVISATGVAPGPPIALATPYEIGDPGGLIRRSPLAALGPRGPPTFLAFC